MNYPNPIRFLIIVISMIQLSIYAQGDALTITHDCTSGSLDLQISGGFSPYDVEL